MAWEAFDFQMPLMIDQDVAWVKISVKNIENDLLTIFEKFSTVGIF